MKECWYLRNIILIPLSGCRISTLKILLRAAWVCRQREFSSVLTEGTVHFLQALSWWAIPVAKHVWLRQLTMFLPRIQLWSTALLSGFWGAKKSDPALGKDWCTQYVPCEGIKLFTFFSSDRPWLWSKYKECIIISIQGSHLDESSILLLMPHQSVNCLLLGFFPLLFSVKITDDVILLKFMSLVFACKPGHSCYGWFTMLLCPVLQMWGPSSAVNPRLVFVFKKFVLEVSDACYYKYVGKS